MYHFQVVVDETVRDLRFPPTAAVVVEELVQMMPPSAKFLSDQ